MSRAPKGRIPRYRQIAAEIARSIGSGAIAVGELLPSEAELAVRFDVTRMTIRQALGVLAAQDLIERRQGMGTFVAPKRIVREPGRPTSLTQELLRRGYVPGGRAIIQGIVPAPTEVQEVLRLRTRSMVLRIMRIRLADEVPVGIQQSWIPAALVPGLEAMDVTDLSLSAVLQDQFSLVVAGTETMLGAVEANQDFASLLNLPIGSALLYTRMTSYLPNGRQLEFGEGWYPGSRYDYLVRQGSVPTQEDLASGGSPRIPMRRPAPTFVPPRTRL